MENAQAPGKASGRGNQWMPIVLLAVVGVIAAGVYWWDPGANDFSLADNSTLTAQPTVDQTPPRQGRSLSFGDRRQLTLWWEAISAPVRQANAVKTDHSNIARADYVGPDNCQRCHEENYQLWSTHSHRWMNALAADHTVKGDFDGAEMEYLGGRATFFQDGDSYRMRLERDGLVRLYAISQTIGSRFTQYYVGKLVEGPEPRYHQFYLQEHVLPFGYWLEKKMWVPIVHVGPEVPDGERNDPFAPAEGQPFFQDYASKCSCCHSTYPFGDWLIREADLAGLHVPRELHMAVEPYLRENQPGLLHANRAAEDYADQELAAVLTKTTEIQDVREHVASFGITCESCHYGSREHAQGKLKKPYFFPASPHLSTVAADSTLDLGRNHTNINWTCGRCHIGHRPKYANGLSTWNSTEFSDAMRGSCYSQATCIECHNPHQGIGQQWKRTPAQDDASCLKCHQQLAAPADIEKHTHHAAGSTGSRCMNCHMPRYNEGLQDLVRTHTIFSPTDAKMIESNQMNACNTCHTDWNIDRTIGYLRDWYGATYSKSAIAANYPDREQPVALGWLKSDNEAVRLVGADVLIRTQSQWALDHLISALDDPFLINRQFAGRSLENWLGLNLDDFGYRFYLTPEERSDPLRRLRDALQKKLATTDQPPSAVEDE